jgi:hypothetical protein
LCRPKRRSRKSASVLRRKIAFRYSDRRINRLALIMCMPLRLTT